MSQIRSTVAVIGIDIGKNSFHVVGLDGDGAVVLRQKWSRGQVESRLANAPLCLIGMEACVGAHWERHGLKRWIEAAKKRLHRNVLAIALANKLARIAWAVLARGRAFEAMPAVSA